MNEIEIKEIEKKDLNNKKELTENDKKDIEDIQAEIKELKAKVEKDEFELSTKYFKNNQMYYDSAAASVVGDTVGDPLKDTSGPSVNILIKLSSIVSVVFGTLFLKTSYLVQNNKVDVTPGF